jgi:hypothetical protein
MKKISHLLAQDERRRKPPITLPRLTAADDAARSRDEVLAIPADRRRARVESGDLKTYKRPRQQRYTDVSAALVTEKPESENDEKKATQKTTLVEQSLPPSKCSQSPTMRRPAKF